MIHLSDQGAWVISGVSTAVTISVVAWATTGKVAIRLIPGLAMMFILIVGTSLARSRPISTPSLVYTDVMISTSFFFIMLRRSLRRLEIVDTPTEAQRTGGEKFVNRTLFSCLFMIALLILAEYLA